MKDVSSFPARYNLIKLYRKAVHDSDGDEDMNSSQTMLAMDYFDALEVDESFTLTKKSSASSWG